MRSKVTSFIAVALLAISSFTSASDSFAQARPSSRGTFLGGDPFGVLWGYALSAQYESRISQDNSWALRLAIYPEKLGESGFGIGGSYRFYIADGRALTGLSISPAADLVLTTSGNLSSTYLLVGADLAYKWIFNDGFGIEPYLWLRNGFVASQYGNGARFSGIRPAIGLWIGYAW
jgi:hypothetical protein